MSENHVAVLREILRWNGERDAWNDEEHAALSAAITALESSRVRVDEDAQADFDAVSEHNIELQQAIIDAEKLLRGGAFPSHADAADWLHEALAMSATPSPEAAGGGDDAQFCTGCRSKILGNSKPDLAAMDWPDGVKFYVNDEPGEHDPCYLVMPGGSSLAFAHHATNGVDQARARFIADACNRALAAPGDAAREVSPELTCSRCFGGNRVPWFAPNDLWNQVVGSPNGILCARCFMEAAQKAGIDCIWSVAPAPQDGGRECSAVGALVAAANAVLAANPNDDTMWSLEAAVAPFNARKPDECAGGCPPQQVCDYCQIAALAAHQQRGNGE